MTNILTTQQDILKAANTANNISIVGACVKFAILMVVVAIIILLALYIIALYRGGTDMMANANKMIANANATVNNLAATIALILAQPNTQATKYSTLAENKLEAASPI